MVKTNNFVSFFSNLEENRKLISNNISRGGKNEKNIIRDKKNKKNG